jgi:hypothetical protein
MKTDDLISAIVQDGLLHRPSVAMRVTGALTAGGLVAGVLFVHMLGIRPDIANALQTWRFPTKVLITVVSFAAALWASAQLARPDADRRKALFALALPMALLAVAMGCELLQSPAATWAARAVGSNSRLCMMSILGLSLAPLAALLVALRTGAPSSPALSGAVAGLTAGGLGATLYAIHCFDDSPLFVALWYAPAVVLVALVGSGIGYRLLRW